MQRFLKRVTLFLLPIVLLYGVFALVVHNSRELAPLDEVVNATVDGTLTLYGSAYHENFCAYKQRCTAALAPELLVLGTSRSMQLRGEFFTGVRFYNAGGGVKNAAEYLWFLQSLPKESLPRILLCVLDQNMFNETWASESRTEQLYLDDIAVKTDTLGRVGNSYGDGKFSILENLRPKAGVYGLAAAGRGSGFAADGSYRYGKAAEENLLNPEKNFAQTYRDIVFSRARFAWGDTPDETALADMDALLAFCSAHDITVVGMLPPFAPEVFTRMTESGNYGYLEVLSGRLKNLFAGYGFACYDYSCLPETTAVQYLDGYHGGDEVYAEIAQQLAESDAALAPYIDTAMIQTLLDAPHDNPRVLS